ncbi:MAG: NAD(P)-binding protein [Proteobacteria bacterium]|nr:NAD(P)-binding protein [Pseudomonadota bacterium]
MERETIIAGAGLSGLTAALSLARQGRRVRVLEAGERIGGSRSYVDSSYLDPEALKRSLGVDIRPALSPWGLTRAWVYGEKHEFAPPSRVPAYTIERGRGKNSLEKILYRAVKDAGVPVELGVRLTPEQLLALPGGSILATGLDRWSFGALGIPSRPFYCHMATGKGVPGRPDVIIYLDRFTREFGYYFQAGNKAGALVFDVVSPMTPEGKLAFKQRLWENDGIRFENWDDRLAETASWPLGSFSNRRLFARGKILAGTLSGAVSPVLVFGVLGALVSGGIAAQAVDDPEGAKRRFARLMPLYFPQMAFRRIRENAPHALLKPLCRGLVKTYHPRYFPWLMMFAAWPVGLGRES